jgi:hypothetical protein
MVHSLSVGTNPLARSAKSVLKVLTPQRARRGLMRSMQRRLIAADSPEADEQLMAELRARYRPEVKALSEYLDRDLIELWGYGDDA